jgi:hypothetical protein
MAQIHRYFVGAVIGRPQVTAEIFSLNKFSLNKYCIVQVSSCKITKYFIKAGGR